MSMNYINRNVQTSICQSLQFVKIHLRRKRQNDIKGAQQINKTRAAVEDVPIVPYTIKTPTGETIEGHGTPNPSSKT
jgi:hypothetical protein